MSVAEVDYQDQWQRTAIAVAVVGGTEHHVRDVLATIERFVVNAADIEVLDIVMSWLESELS